MLDDNIKIWIITEWDRSVTTVLLPEEYWAKNQSNLTQCHSVKFKNQL
jgi:hypothetical protein